MDKSLDTGSRVPLEHKNVIVLHDYEGFDGTTLTLHKGDIVEVMDRLESGWWFGMLHGIRGWFPSNYCATFDAYHKQSEDRPAAMSLREQSTAIQGQHESQRDQTNLVNPSHVDSTVETPQILQKAHQARSLTGYVTLPPRGDSLTDGFRSFGSIDKCVERDGLNDPDVPNRPSAIEADRSYYLHDNTSLDLLSAGIQATSVNEDYGHLDPLTTKSLRKGSYMYRVDPVGKSMVELKSPSIDAIPSISITHSAPETQCERPGFNISRSPSYGCAQDSNTSTDSLLSAGQRSEQDASCIQPLSSTSTSELQMAKDMKNSQQFTEVDSVAEMMYDMQVKPPQLRGGTVLAFVEHLTRDTVADPQFEYVFLLTYRSFTTGQDLFNMLRDRWRMEPPYGLSVPDADRWIREKQMPIRLRITSVVKSWLDDFWMEADTKASQQLLTKIMRFANDMVRPVSRSQAICLQIAIEQRKVRNNEPNPGLTALANVKTPPLASQKLSKTFQILRINTAELAEQLTIIDSELYRKVKASECFWKTWSQLDGESSRTESVKTVILHCNKVSNWIARTILEQQESKRQAMIIARFVIIAERCRTLDNFSGVTSIIAGLAIKSICHLSASWALVSVSTMASLNSLRTLMSSTRNFETYRNTLRNTNPPCVPFLGIYLADLGFIETGLPSFLRAGKLINYTKLSKFADVILEMQQYQRTHHSLRSIPELQAMILREMQSTADPVEMHTGSISSEQHAESSKIPLAQIK